MSGRFCISCSCAAVLLLHTSLAAAQAAPQAPSQEPSGDRLEQHLDVLDEWLGDGPNGDQWRRFFHADDLRGELAKNDDADPAVLMRSLRRLEGAENGLKLPPFEQARKALARRVAELKNQRAANLPALARASRGDYAPIPTSHLDALHQQMVTAARALEQALNAGGPEYAAAWKKYLGWELLEPHLTGDHKTRPSQLAELDEFLRRIHTNQAGLELPVFTELASAASAYRNLAPWIVATSAREGSPIYDRLVTRLSDLLERHIEKPTTETEWKVGRALGLLDSLGRSPELVGAVRRQLAKPNIYGSVSTQFLTRMPTRNVNQIRPVRDCILGTAIFGSAHSFGDVRYELLPAEDKVDLVIRFRGQANSRTRGYNGPVRINSTGNTTFWAAKRLWLNDDQFIAGESIGDADTRTRIRSIQKTGGQFGHRIVEKIAWKRAMEQKRQSERIAAQHAQERVISELNQNVARDLAAQRSRYEKELRAPLIRRGVSPEYLRMGSRHNGVFAETVFATRRQLGAAGPPPRRLPGHDLAIQVHQSAVNNYLPLALAAARIAQESPDKPADLSGNVPNWLKVMAIGRPKLAAAAEAGIEAVEQAQEKIEEIVGAEEKAPATPPFRPYSITLNGEAPISITFDDGKIAIRVRAAELASEDSEYENWDFIVTYRITTEGNRIILKRIGDIEVFPTDFDPVWDRRMTPQQTAFRNTLAGNMNARAKAGGSFPEQVPIEPLQFTQFGVMALRELVADDGWLTVGWALPPPGPGPALSGKR